VRALGLLVIGAAVIAAGGCGSTTSHTTTRLPPDYVPRPIGRGAAFRPPAVSAQVARRGTVAGLGCARTHPASYGIHLEIYANTFVVPIPAGIGVAPPQRRQGAYVLGGRCTYPLRTFEPTGVAVVDRRPTPPSLATLFALWGQRLSGDALLSFHGRVSAFLNGVRWPAAPGAIALRRHAEIVLEIGGHVPPHPSYEFPPGL
jgi:hypothetical protein